MDEPHLERLPRFSTIGLAEKITVCRSLHSPLSGYLGGIDKAGYFVTRLQERWCEAFGCKFAVACNSATSGLLASCMAIGIKPGDLVWTTAYSMSATAACAKVLGAYIAFIDIETIRFSMNLTSLNRAPLPKCIIVTNLFGHPAYLSSIRSWCDSNKVWMIEDNAQAPFAKEDGRYAGTVAHLGVFSLNVHKHIQCGEGGVVATDSAELNHSVLGAINHGELAGRPAGLNLRMSEPIGSIACAQLAKAPAIIEGRIDLAEEITDMVKGTYIVPPTVAKGCKHVYYYWSGLIRNGMRDAFIKGMERHRVPFRKGYSPPLHRVFSSNTTLPVVEQIEDEQIVCFEICTWNPKRHHLNRMREFIKKVAGI